MTTSSYTLKFVNFAGIDSNDRSFYVLGFSTASKQQLGADGKFASVKGSGTIPSFDIQTLGTITLDATSPLIGARIYVFAVGKGDTQPGLSFRDDGATVIQPTNPPNSVIVIPPPPKSTDPAKRIPSPLFNIVEITVPVGDRGPTIDVQTVDGFVFPLTISLFDAQGNALGEVGQPPDAKTAATRAAIRASYDPFMVAQGDAGKPYRSLAIDDAILNPGLFLAATNATNDPSNLDSPLNGVWDATLNGLFSLSTLSIQGVASNPGETGPAIPPQVYLGTPTEALYPKSSFKLPALRFANLSNDVQFLVFNPVGVTVATDASGKPLTGTITGTTLTLTSAPPPGLVVDMFVSGAGTDPSVTVKAIDGMVLTLSKDLVNPAPGSQYQFSKIPGLFETSGRMVFANDGLFADNTVQFPPGSSQATVLGNLENQIVSAVNRGVAVNGPTSGPPGYTSKHWATQSEWYPSDLTHNLFSLFMHTATVEETPIFVQPKSAARNAQGVLMGQAYGFAFDENAGPTPPGPSGQPDVPSKYDPVPAGTVSMTITLGPWGA